MRTANSIDRYPLSELKLVYRVLQSSLRMEPGLENCDLLTDLQILLRRHAEAEGVDISLQTAWFTWLRRGTDEDVGTSFAK